MEERFHGELGHREWAVHVTGLGHCSCDGCGGHLDDGSCQACGCWHGIQEPTRHVRDRYAMWGPVAEEGRCATADAVRERDRQEEERVRRQREREGHGDPTGRPGWLVRLHEIARERGA